MMLALVCGFATLLVVAKDAVRFGRWRQLSRFLPMVRPLGLSRTELRKSEISYAYPFNHFLRITT
jgi:hypothetical protein